MAEAKATGLSAEHRSVDTSSVTLPNEFGTTAPFVHHDFGYFAFIYNQEGISKPA